MFPAFKGEFRRCIMLHEDTRAKRGYSVWIHYQPINLTRLDGISGRWGIALMIDNECTSCIGYIQGRMRYIPFQSPCSRETDSPRESCLKRALTYRWFWHRRSGHQVCKPAQLGLVGLLVRYLIACLIAAVRILSEVVS